MTIDVLSLTTGIDRPTYNIVPCFACGATFIYMGRRGDLNGRFCSLRCQTAYDDGFTPQPAEQPDTLTGWRVATGGEIGGDYYANLLKRTPIPMKRTADGFKIACAGCQKEFESKRLRCCSDACERRYRERAANFALMAEVGIEPARKRPCAAPGCSSTIPKWRKGQAVSKSARFCSRVCSRRAKRATEQPPEPAQ